MTSSPAARFSRQPWHELHPSLAPLIRHRMEEIVRDMIEAIRTEVPAYRRPLDSAVGRDLTESIRRALRQFAELVEDPDGPQDHHIQHFRQLGRIEYLGGRTTDGLQAAFRVGARVGSRRYAEIVQEASLPPELVVPLHEAVLIHINTLANECVAGFLAAQMRSEGEIRRARRALTGALLEQPRGEGHPALEPLAERARWPLPRTLACVLVRPGIRLPVSGTEVDGELLGTQRGNDTVLIVPGPESGDLLARIRKATQGRAAVVGPAVDVREAWLSAQSARLALDHRGPEGGGELFLYAEDELAELHLLRAAPIGRLLARRVLDAFAGLPSGKAARLAETLDALLMSWGRTAPEVARALGIHPQTARQRLRQLDALFGERLADPRFRFEALLALRTRAALPPPAEGAGGAGPAAG